MALWASKKRHLPPFLIDFSLVFPEFFPRRCERCRRLSEMWREKDGFWRATKKVRPLPSVGLFPVLISRWRADIKDMAVFLKNGFGEPNSPVRVMQPGHADAVRCSKSRSSLGKIEATAPVIGPDS